MSAVLPAAPDAVDPEARPEVLFDRLGTRRAGLSPREAQRRLQQYGPNRIERRVGPSALRDLAAQFTHPLALLLWVAALLAFVTGTVALAAAIVAVIVLNAVFAFAQERQAERATEALSQFLPPHARVRRDGEVVDVDATMLVPGDMLLVGEGDRLSADARLIAGAVELDLSPLTGEAQPQTRSAAASRRATTRLEAEDLIFAGTLCTGGEAEAVVYATGMATELGRIATLTQRVQAEISPLQSQVNRAAQLIAVVAVGAGIVFFAAGAVFAGLTIGQAATFAIGLLVANVPEGLLPTITLALAVGVRRMARRRALVKRLTAVETLGSTSVICTDKTGTLTEGRMAVAELWADGLVLGGADGAAALAPPLAALLHDAVRCANARIERDGVGWGRSGDPSESALLVAAAAHGVDVEAAQAQRAAVRRRLLAFDAHRKRMSTIDAEPDGLWLHAKGAPLELLGRCTTVLGADGAERALTEGDRAAVHTAFEERAARGLRVLGYARRRLRADENTDDRDATESGLCLLGLAALEDPPRAEVPDAVARCRAAGIRIILITGDHGLTAQAVARQVGIATGPARVVTGPELDGMPDAAVDELLRAPGDLIVARSSPEAKLRIVEALQAEGTTVAMTGDGVNDAPALRRADIGVAMGASGTDVAREAATMVLTDDSFASIVAAVGEGRTVYENIRKFIVYIFAHATPEVVPFLLFALSGGAIPLPLTALQILAIDLGTETLPALALGREPPEPDLMRRPPRPREGGILTRAMLTRAWLWLGLLEAALVTGGFLWVLTRAGWHPGDATGRGTGLHHAYLQATTMTFAGICACQVGTAFAARTSRASLRQIGVLSNPLLLWGIAFELVFAAAVVYLPPLQLLFDTRGLRAEDLLVLATFPLIVWSSDELRRWALRRADRGRR
ncbi:MAG: cation-translocating P-type ATPase [Solirubrobacteraceae bacterium]